MLRTQLLPVNNLAIDLQNFRTVPQKNEVEAINAMISISPDYFWGLMESLLDDGYLPTENIIVLDDPTNGYQVKEGNRRVASLKIILGLVAVTDLELPAKVVERIGQLSADWVSSNTKIPCTIYQLSEAAVVDKIVTLTHGKGEKAGRDAWESVARARHNKVVNRASEPGLELLEKYLVHGTNLTDEQKLRWAGKYYVTVLDEAIKKIAQRLGASSGVELAKLYPKISHKKPLDEILYAIGTESLGYRAIRESTDFALRFGVPPLPPPSTGQNPTASSLNGTSGSGGAPNAGSSSGTQAATNPTANPVNTGGQTNPSPTTQGSSTSTTGRKPLAAATNNEQSVRKALRSLKLYGTNRDKVVTLRNEILKLKLKDNPIAFCFLLRSMFEISAKAYCQDHASEQNAPKYLKNDGSDRTLADILRDIVSHLTQNKTDKQMVKLLHGPLTEIQRPDGILSITSMNHLVHNPKFTILPSDIPTLFSNIVPLLDQMNK
ncbi:hypothetical protein [Methylomonas sp. MgM2]